jgi:hypothetical protein
VVGDTYDRRRVTMHTRLLTFTGATDIDRGLAYLQEEVVPVLNAQHGYRGITASADRGGAVMNILSVWETEADRAASDSALGKAREEAVKIVGGALTIENFEQVAHEVKKPPVAGCALLVIRVSMDSASVDENIDFFKRDVVPVISGRPGFCSLRNMMDRSNGRGLVGTVWEDRRAMDGYAATLPERRSIAEAHGISFDETATREMLFVSIN